MTSPGKNLHSKSPNALSNAELMAILLNKGTQDKSAVELAREVLSLTNNDLSALSRNVARSIDAGEGIGMAKASAIAACPELGRCCRAGFPKRLSPG